MPRPRRQVISGVPLHITQRGVDRGVTFRDEEDFAYYRWALHEAAEETGVGLHAYVLMTNHVHLLMTPSDPGSAAALFRSLGRRYVRRYNARHQRTGTLWEGRFRSALIDTVSYLFACSRYIELNPVRAAIADEPRRYPWSSFRHNVDGRIDPLITEHPAYLALGPSQETRRAAYDAMFSRVLTAEALTTLRAAQVSRARYQHSGTERTVGATIGGPGPISGEC